MLAAGATNGSSSAAAAAAQPGFSFAAGQVYHHQQQQQQQVSVPGTRALSQSMMLLEESLESGAVVSQFEQLYRRNPNLSISVCHLQENMNKNRYRDISPYDATRVVLKECPSGDYINANHVRMTIPGSGIINRYIATQGPLAATSGDFWYMTWESQADLVIMLTTIVERGRVKCHKYWPDRDEVLELDGGLRVKCVHEEDERSPNASPNVPAAPPTERGESHPSFAYRDFELTRGGERRVVAQMAYLSWPDHGVPDSPDEFVAFVERVRNLRQVGVRDVLVEFHGRFRMYNSLFAPFPGLPVPDRGALLRRHRTHGSADTDGDRPMSGGGQPARLPARSHQADAGPEGQHDTDSQPVQVSLQTIQFHNNG